MEKIIISVIIPTYNRAHLIGETIESIQKQSFKQWECIVVDDGSTDSTDLLLQKIIDKDSRISFYKKPKHLLKGPSAARNYGFTKSWGDYINWFDSDDLMYPEKMETDLKHITSGDFDFTISQSTFFREQGKPKKKYWNNELWSEDPINDFICKKIGWGVNSPLWSRKRLEAIHLIFDEQLMTADDFKFHLQALQYGLKPVVVNQALVNLREHSDRLDDYPDKASNKLRTYIYLIKHEKALKLNAYTISYLNWHFVKFYTWLLKGRNIRLGTKILIDCWFLNFTLNTKAKVFKLWLLGLFYFVFGKGYKLLKH